MLDIATRRSEGTIQYALPRGSSKIPVEKIAHVRGFAPWHLMIASAEYMTDIDETFWRMGVTASKVIGVLLLCSIGIAWVVARSVVKPLAALKARMTSLSAGEPNSPLAGEDRRDELGEMARAVLIFMEHMASESRHAGEQDAERAGAEGAKRAALVKMADTVESETETALQQIGVRTTVMAAASDTMSASATRTGASAQDAATAAGHALVQCREGRGRGRAIWPHRIREIGSQMSLSTVVVRRAVAAGTGAHSTMEALNQEVERIRAVADMIGEIAWQNQSSGAQRDD